jgi:hypothetical protein
MPQTQHIHVGFLKRPRNPASRLIFFSENQKLSYQKLLKFYTTQSDNQNISRNKNIGLFFLITFVKDIQTQIK